MAALSIRALSKRYANLEVLKGIDLDIESGEFTVLVGPSGCGKSTLLNIVAGLDRASDGTIEIGGRVVNDVPPKDRDIAMVFQSYALYPHMTVEENLTFGLRRRRIDRAEIDRRVRAAAETLGLSALLARKPNALSGGQRQRVALGRAMVREPMVFLFDEPLSNLDAALRVNTRNELIKQHHRLGSTMIYVTHDQVEAMTMGTRICVMNGGRVAQIGAPLEVYWQPADTFVARFLGSPPMNLFTVPLASSGGSFHVESAAIRAPLSRWAAATLAPAAGRPVTLGVRAEDLYLDAAPLGGQEKGSIHGTAFAVEPLGAETLLVIETEDGVECTARLSRDIRVSPGETIELFFGARSVYLFDAESGKAIAGDMPGFVAGVLPGRMSGSLQ